jgi:hypothetical protein
VRRVARALTWPLRMLRALAALVRLVVVAHLAKRQPRPEVPRIFFSLDPLLSTPVLAEAAARVGYSTSVGADAGYGAFARALREYDVFAVSSDALFLRRTPLKRRELQLLRLAGKRFVLLPYGGDVWIPQRARNLIFKHALSLDHPTFVRAERRRLDDLDYCLRRADHIVSGADLVDYMSWWDRLSAAPLAVDVDEWKPQDGVQRAQGAPLVVLHAPHDRELQGTQFLVDACDRLAHDGVEIELRVVERATPGLMNDADVVADGFVVGWYTQRALEAMSMEKPVLCYLRDDLLELYTLFSFAGECPVVNAPPRALEDRLRELAGDEKRREELGRVGRSYVTDHHSLVAAGALFDDIFKAVWPREAV